MGIAFLSAPTNAPLKRALMERALDPHILLGMPHLNPHGLSETWLMKELGHRHWLMLAREMGMDDADFRTPDGREAYAAICATSLAHARLDLAKANDVLTIRSTISQISRTQNASLHHITIGADLVAVVELLSVFVARERDNDNRSLVKMGLMAASHSSTASSTLAAAAATFRRDQPDTCLGLPLTSFDIFGTTIVKPSIEEEFNGAGLLYFANFQALASRAITIFRQPPKFDRREVFFHGNINPGETIELRYLASKDEARLVVSLYRSDGSALGLVSTYLNSCR